MYPIQKIISDHYDYNLGKQQTNRKSICKHMENDPTGEYPYKLSGAFDGKVANSSMIKTMSFLARYGSSCGKRHFMKEQYLQQHPEKKNIGNLLLIYQFILGQWLINILKKN
jgi:hypothetical protein